VSQTTRGRETASQRSVDEVGACWKAEEDRGARRRTVDGADVTDLRARGGVEGGGVDSGPRLSPREEERVLTMICFVLFVGAGGGDSGWLRRGACWRCWRGFVVDGHRGANRAEWIQCPVWGIDTDGRGRGASCSTASFVRSHCRHGQANGVPVLVERQVAAEQESLPISH
jgi:hypothetical protein